MARKNNILSIDQSLNNSGIAIYLDDKDEIECQNIKPSKKLNLIEKFIYIEDMLNNYIDKYDINIIIREGFSFMSDGRARFQIAYIGFMVDVIANKLKKELIVIPPQSHKKFTTGKGNSSKSVMLLNVFKRYFIELDDDNIADAVSMLKCYQAMERYLAGNLTDLKSYQIDVIEKLLKDD